MKVAVLGSGGMGRTVIEHLKECSWVRQIAAYDVVPARLEEVKSRFAVDTTSRLESILDDPTVRLVFITASNNAHADLSIGALRAGKAVMCEKPMAASLPDAERMVQAAGDNRGFLQIGFELRYSKLYVTVKQWIDAGLIGTVRNIFCQYICSEFHRRGSWRNQTSAGGMFGEKLSHYVDLPRWWVGEPVTQVQSFCAPNVLSYMECRDNYHTSYRFTGGAVGHLTFMMHVAETFAGDPLRDYVNQQVDDGHALRYLIYGDKGAIETDVFRRRVRRWEFTDAPDGLNSRIAETRTWTKDEDHAYFHNTRGQAHDIVRRVRDGLPPMIAPEDALETTELCFAAEQSADTGCAVNLAGMELDLTRDMCRA